MIFHILGPTTPTFSLSEERSFDGSPKINIVFANGKSDTLILTRFEDGEEDKIETGVEECRYLVHICIQSHYIEVAQGGVSNRAIHN
jgi:hypothetical protein